MFKLIEKYQIDRRIRKCDYIRYSPSEISTINTPNSQIYINIPRGDSVINLKGSLLRLNFDVLHAATSNRYKVGNDIRLDNLEPIALFSFYKLATNSGKHIEEINHAHIGCLLYKLETSSRGSDDLSLGFDRSRDRGKQVLTNSKTLKGNYHVTIMLSVIFAFAAHQLTGTLGLGYQLT